MAQTITWRELNRFEEETEDNDSHVGPLESFRDLKTVCLEEWAKTPHEHRERRI